MNIREYQQECIEKIEAEWARGHRRVLAVLATGTGKTIIFLEVLNRLPKTARALVLAHRRELIHQPIERAKEFFSGLYPDMGVVMADQDDFHARIVVATVQSLQSPGRLERILEHGPIDLIVCDEAHHGTASSYRKVFDALPEARVLGMTATPLRTDGDGLARVFDAVAYKFPIHRAIASGALVPFDAVGYTLPVSFVGVKETEDGWEPESVGDLLKAKNAMEVVYEKWQMAASNRQTLAFTASVAQAHDTAAYFAERGVAAEAVDGTTPKAERDALLGRYKRGETRVVFNCMVLTEGFDAPETAAVMMIAPTKSDLIYVQRLGRGLRTVAGKTDCVVLDFSPLEARNVIMAGDVLGLPREAKKAVECAEKAGVLIGSVQINRWGMIAAVDPEEVVMKALKYLRGSPLAWALDGNMATASLSATAMVAVVLPDMERLAKAQPLRALSAANERLFQEISRTRLVLLTKSAFGWSAETVGGYGDIEEAQDKASGLAEELLDARLGKKSASWRTGPPTTQQLWYASCRGVAVPDGCTKGQLSQLIAQAIARKKTLEHLRGQEAEIWRGSVQ